MKHRSTGIFIIVLAALVAAPSASQQLLALKDAAASRFEATLWNAFLSLNGRHAEPAAGATAPIQQAGPSEVERAARERRTTDAPAKARETARPEPPRAAGREDADARERFVASLDTADRLFVIDPEGEGVVRFATPVALPFDLDRLVESARRDAHAAADADANAARARAAEAAGRQIKVFAALPEVALKHEQAVRVAPRVRAPKGVMKRLPVAGFQPSEWPRPTVDFSFDYNETEKAAPRHSESYTRR